MNAGIIVDNDLINDKRVLREIKIIREEGYEAFVLCFGFRGKQYPAMQDISVTRITISKRLKNILFFLFNTLPVYEWLWISWICKFINANNIDLLHVHDLYMSRAAFQGRLRSRKNIPLILDLHENFPFAVKTYNWTKGLFRTLVSQPGKWKRKENKYLNLADRIIVLSDDFKTELMSRYPGLEGNKFSVLPNVPDLSEAGFDTPVPVNIPFRKTAPVIFYFGIIAERRGIFDAIEVFTELVIEKYQALLLLIGPVDKKDKKRFENALNTPIFKEKIIHIPWIDLSELPAYLDISDICIAPFHKNPQHESGVANKIFDYMLGAKPVVASDCRPQQKIIEKHNCGLIFRNKSEFKFVLIQLLNNEELRNTMGKNGNEAVIESYGLANTRQNLIHLYDSLR